jgi:hypothetical protein
MEITSYRLTITKVTNELLVTLYSVHDKTLSQSIGQSVD